MSKKSTDREMVATRLKQARARAGYKRAKDFAEKHSLSLPTYYRHEDGTRSISLKSLTKYAEWLNVHPGWLMSGEEKYLDLTTSDKLSDEEFAELVESSEEYDKTIHLRKDMINKERLTNIIVEIYHNIQENKGIDNHIQYAVHTAIDIYFNAISTTNNAKLQDEIIKSAIQGLLLGLKQKKETAI